MRIGMSKKRTLNLIIAILCSHAGLSPGGRVCSVLAARGGRYELISTPASTLTLIDYDWWNIVRIYSGLASEFRAHASVMSMKNVVNLGVLINHVESNSGIQLMQHKLQLNFKMRFKLSTQCHEYWIYYWVENGWLKLQETAHVVYWQPLVGSEPMCILTLAGISRGERWAGPS